MVHNTKYAMNLYELDSFVTKFKFLTEAGFQANYEESINDTEPHQEVAVSALAQEYLDNPYWQTLSRSP